MIGTYKLLNVIKKTPAGYVLEDTDSLETAFLYFNQIVGEVEVGDSLVFFIYSDDEKLYATMKTPLAIVGDIKRLEVVNVKEFGAFVSIGIDKDVFVPIKEMEERLEVGKSYLFYIYVDRNRLCASNKRVYNNLTTKHNYKVNDLIKGSVIRVNEDMGAFIAIDDTYHGFLHKSEIFDKIEVGSELNLRVKKIRDDKKIELTFKNADVNQLEVDANTIMDILSKAGKLMVHDNTDKEDIYKIFKMSKRSFKKAIGRLYKENKIIINSDSIEIKTKFNDSKDNKQNRSFAKKSNDGKRVIRYKYKKNE